MYYHSKNDGPVTLAVIGTSAELTVFIACINQRVKGHLLFYNRDQCKMTKKKKVQFSKGKSGPAVP